MYTTPAASRARRSAQTVMHHIAECIVRWLAPVLSFTAEEIWEFLPGERSESVFLETWHQLPEVSAADIEWPALLQLRGDVTRELERLRDAGSIGAPLDAEVDVYCAPQEYERFSALGDELRFFFITSHARVHRIEGEPPAAAVPAANIGRSGVWIVVKPTSDPKCIRCWQHRPDVGSNPRHPEICGRCVSNVDGPGEERRFV
jgi:isoleucyl-tRNA synthetase